VMHLPQLSVLAGWNPTDQEIENDRQLREERGKIHRRMNFFRKKNYYTFGGPEFFFILIKMIGMKLIEKLMT
jgi:hypothetical protein